MTYNTPQEGIAMDVKAIDLFKAYGEDKLPREGGYIITSFFQDNSAYAKYEIVAYNGLKSLYLTEEGLTFQTDGNKLFVLAEPVNYDKKYMEPFTRDGQHQVPHRFNELEQLTCKNMTRIMISRQPVIAYSSFTILRPTTLNFSLLFYNLPDVLDSIASYFTRTLNAEAAVPTGDAAEAARHIVEGLRRFTIWQDLEEMASAESRPKPKPKAAAKPKAKAKPAAKTGKPSGAKAETARKPAAKTGKPPGAKAKTARKPAAKTARKLAR
jgi:hypothetical protein